MFKCACRLLNALNKSSQFNLRNISNQAPRLAGAKTYEGEGKTSIQILNNEADLGLMINGYSQIGFRLNNGMTVLGPMVIFPRSVLSWNIKSAEDITEESLSLFTVLEPKVDILVLGIGDKPDDFSIYRQLIPLGQKLKLNLEILPTDQACATFNFLNSESRIVTAAMIPPPTIQATDDDVMNSKLRYQNLYETNEPPLF